MNPTAQLPPVNPNLSTGLTQGQIQAQIEANRQAIGQQTANIPQTIQQYSPATDSMIGSLRNNQAAKLQELFSHDTQLAQTYAPIQNAPGPSTGQVAMPENNQAIIDPGIGLRAANTQTMSTAKELADIGTQIAQRKDVLTQGLDSAMKLLQYGLQARELQNAALEKEAGINTSNLTSALDVLSKTGGTLPPELANIFGLSSTDRIPSEAEKLKLQYGYTSEGRKINMTNAIMNDVMNGSQLKDIVPKYKGSGLTDEEIVGAYDTAANQKGLGPHKETVQQLRAMGLNEYTPPQGTQLTTKEVDNVNNSASLLSLIDSTMARLKNVKSSDMGPGQGNIYNTLFKIGAGGMLPEDLRVIGQNLLQMQGMGDRTIMGGRLIRDLVTMFGPSFPNLNFTKEQNMNTLTQMRNKIINQLNVSAKNNYYQDVTGVPGLEGIDTTQYLIVKDKKTGQVGRIPENEFDSKLYTKF